MRNNAWSKNSGNVIFVPPATKRFINVIATLRGKAGGVHDPA
jgi:hypothetical protein